MAQVAEPTLAGMVRLGTPEDFATVHLTGVLAGLLLTTKPAAAGILLGVFVGVNLLSSGLLFATTGLWLKREGAQLHG